jgi:hypothetical protein
MGRLLPHLLRNQTIYPFYAVGYATADDPLGPSSKMRAIRFLAVDWEHDFWGPGGDSVVTDAQERLWMFYHTKVSPQTGWEREIRINELVFDAHARLRVVLDDDDDDDDNDDNDNMTTMINNHDERHRFDDDDNNDDDVADDDAGTDDDQAGRGSG